MPAIATARQTRSSAAVSEPASAEEARCLLQSPQKRPSNKTKRKPYRQHDNEDGDSDSGSDEDKNDEDEDEDTDKDSMDKQDSDDDEVEYEDLHACNCKKCRQIRSELVSYFHVLTSS
ncbi:hypothetical protein C8Q74DRAFT_1220204 [Fomes fomentarius]|nr:hypothetical protein C8Q74DRAFT_1220204 [Fomes fomentarius]